MHLDSGICYTCIHIGVRPMTTAVRLPETLEKRLNHLAKETHRSKSFYIKRAVEDFLEEREDYLLALAIKERIDSGKEKTYSLEEVEKMAGLKNG